MQAKTQVKRRKNKMFLDEISPGRILLILLVAGFVLFLTYLVSFIRPRKRKYYVNEVELKKELGASLFITGKPKIRL